MRKLPFISIIIPTYNRAKLLKVGVESLLKLNYPNYLYEIVICDNNSSDSTREVAEEFKSSAFVPVIYFFEKRQGLHFARNSAAKIARGEILYFTDDDMIADPMMLTELVKVFDLDPQIGCATGKILPNFLTPPPKWVRRCLINCLLSLTETDKPEELIVTRTHYLVFGCHQAIRREVFFRTGGFNPENTGKVCLGDGEMGLNLKIRHLGYYFGYTAKSITYHTITPDRMTLQYLVRRIGNEGNVVSYADYRLHREKKLIIPNLIRRNTIGIFIRYVKTFAKIILGRESWHFLPAYIVYFYNRNRYDLKLLRDDSFRRMVEIDNWLAEDLKDYDFTTKLKSF